MNFKVNESGFKLATNCEKMRLKLNEKDWILTTLAIIGSGIAGRTLLYNLSKSKLNFDQITLFSSDHFTEPCTFNSTAVVASRGVTSGHSGLGDLLFDCFNAFKSHVEEDSPAGVLDIIQFSGSSSNLENFKKRYPDGKINQIFLKNKYYIHEEKAFLIDPKTYADWLLSEAKIKLGSKLVIIPELVTEVTNESHVMLKTQTSNEYRFGKVVFATGSYQRFWKGLVSNKLLDTSKPAQGSYFEFNQVELKQDSFSLTFDGMNLIWNKSLKRLLVGSTTSDAIHILPPQGELEEIYKKLTEIINFPLPGLSQATVKTGLREKAKKREPYLFCEGNCIFIGGLYKNGYSLSIGMTKNLSRLYL